ncbi:alkaline phosphatase [Ectothiorhodospiraceae bacterium BW-2]|nr:alkaline phosphatase [Ectothiorhodospiraceae bacterium BW-2]
MMNGLTRRAFLIAMAQASTACVISLGLTGCNDDDKEASFEHGVASGDPLSDSVIIWTRVTPVNSGEVVVSWEVATDSGFTNLVNTDSTTTEASNDYTIKVDVRGLTAGTKYYYRFKAGNSYSATGETMTLPTGSLDSLKMALFSCAMWEHGYFHAYADAAKQSPDVVFHSGDYIYEYASGKYPSPTGSPIRVFEPTHEIVTLEDYRQRYAQYRTDAALQELHRIAPWIVIWDDHEVANDSYKEGAENHDESEGDYITRKAAALQAYYEWLPIRIQNPNDLAQAYRSFDFGDLLSLHVLETRLLARDLSAAGKQSQLALIQDPAERQAAMADLTATLADSSRKLMGETQMAWLQQKMSASMASWQVLGNETMMAQMKLPQSILLFELDATDFAAIAAMLQYNATMGGAPTAATMTDDGLETAIVAALIQAGLSEEQAAAMAPEKVTKLEKLAQETKLPYNLDAWDGYPYEQATVMGMAAQIHQTKIAAGIHSNLIVLTGDSHNSWANNLRFVDPTSGVETPVGVEFAGSSVSSVGLEKELQELLVSGGVITPEQFDADLFAGIFNYYIEDNQFLDMKHRGYTLVTFTKEQAKAEYHQLDNILTSHYDTSAKRITTITVKNGAHKIDSIA